MRTAAEFRRSFYEAEFAREFIGHKTYRPPNGEEGMRFMAGWCEQCAKYDDAGCPILGNMMAWQAHEPLYPVELTHDANGQPCCTAFEEKT